MQSPATKQDEAVESQSQLTTPFTCPYSVALRRNPSRKARPTPRQAALPFDSHQPVAISSFSTDDVVSSTEPSGGLQLSEDLKVFLRIRPLKVGGEKCVGKDGELKSRRNAWPKGKKERDVGKDKKLKSSVVSCIVVNDDSRSVTVSPPIAQQDLRRPKAELYEGFSQVFAPESSQEEVYNRMMKPLVEDFIRGKSGMLVAMGPSGSGKTHTVFGCPRDPGMVPLALRKIFDPNGDSQSTASRSFFITIFEISSERGKSEKILDLLSDGAEVSIYQSTIKGLQETVISNVAQAESVIALAMLKRSTAMTKANSQSSRSQCVINIHLDTQKVEGKRSNGVVLTIIDLAGAERSKRTGLQGKQLGESNFINNTSMVFSLCLRSLFEHQKNPKKPLQKHFQSSLLTRYLRDYLEGKKRMSLILTVKSEEEDYTDTSFVLRQASPYMQIKFTDTVQPDLPGAKRRSPALARADQAKRMKIGNFTRRKADRKGYDTEIDHQFDEEATVIEKIKESPPQSAQIEPLDEKGINDDSQYNFKELKRSSQITQNFAKAIWNVLKEYKSKLKVAENEIDNLKENLDFEKIKRLELEKEIQYIKSNCSCSKNISTDSDLVQIDAYLEFSAERSQKHVEITCIAEKFNTTDNLICHTSPCIDSAREFDSPKGQNLEACLQDNCDSGFTVNNTVGELRMDDSLQESSGDCNRYSSSFVGSIRDNEQINTTLPSTELAEPEENKNGQQTVAHVLLGYTSPDHPESTNIKNNTILGATSAVTDGFCYLLGAPQDKYDQINERPPELVESESNEHDQLPHASVSTPYVADKVCSLLGSSQKKHEQETEGIPDQNIEETSRVPRLAISSQTSVKTRGDSPQSKTGKPVQHSNENKEIISKKQSNQKDDKCDNGLVANDTQKNDTKPSPARMCDGKPKRRLQPASTVLLRDMRLLDLEDESDNRSKGHRGRKKTDTEENQRTQGSNNLLRLLKSNLPR